MIVFENIKKTYGKTTALTIDHLEIPRGQIFGLVGNNGAGKTTMFSLLLDLIQASTGKVHSGDVVVSESENWKSYTGAYINESFLLDFLTADEYFTFVAELYGWNKTTLDTFLQKFEALFMGEILGVKKYIRDLSKGNQKKVGIVSALIGDPQIVILDEPFANLDPTNQMRLKKILLDLKSLERIILISSHDLGHVTEVSDRIVLLEKGLVVKDLNKSGATLEELESYFEV
jgi:ABC-2 type transport system ATP-binding protein